MEIDIFNKLYGGGKRTAPVTNSQLNDQIKSPIFEYIFDKHPTRSLNDIGFTGQRFFESEPSSTSSPFASQSVGSFFVRPSFTQRGLENDFEQSFGTKSVPNFNYSRNTYDPNLKNTLRHHPSSLKKDKTVYPLKLPVLLDEEFKNEPEMVIETETDTDSTDKTHGESKETNQFESPSMIVNIELVENSSKVESENKDHKKKNDELKENKIKKRRKYILILPCFLVLVIISAGVGVGISMSINNSNKTVISYSIVYLTSYEITSTTTRTTSSTVTTTTTAEFITNSTESTTTDMNATTLCNNGNGNQGQGVGGQGTC